MLISSQFTVGNSATPYATFSVGPGDRIGSVVESNATPNPDSGGTSGKGGSLPTPSTLQIRHCGHPHKKTKKTTSHCYATRFNKSEKINMIMEKKALFKFQEVTKHQYYQELQT